MSKYPKLSSKKGSITQIRLHSIFLSYIPILYLNEQDQRDFDNCFRSVFPFLWCGQFDTPTLIRVSVGPSVVASHFGVLPLCSTDTHFRLIGARQVTGYYFRLWQKSIAHVQFGVFLYSICDFIDF